MTNGMTMTRRAALAGLAVSALGLTGCITFNKKDGSGKSRDSSAEPTIAVPPGSAPTHKLTEQQVLGKFGAAVVVGNTLVGTTERDSASPGAKAVDVTTGKALWSVQTHDVDWKALLPPDLLGDPWCGDQRHSD